jgi:hypothetical protein
MKTLAPPHQIPNIVEITIPELEAVLEPLPIPLRDPLLELLRDIIAPVENDCAKDINNRVLSLLIALRKRIAPSMRLSIKTAADAEYAKDPRFEEAVVVFKLVQQVNTMRTVSACVAAVRNTIELLWKRNDSTLRCTTLVYHRGWGTPIAIDLDSAAHAIINAATTTTLHAETLGNITHQLTGNTRKHCSTPVSAWHSITEALPPRIRSDATCRLVAMIAEALVPEAPPLTGDADDVVDS